MTVDLELWRQSYKEWEEVFRNINQASEIKIAALVSINLAELDTALQQHPSLYAYASALLEAARIAEVRAKAAYEEKRSEAFSEISEDDHTLAIGKIEKMVDADGDVKRLRTEWTNKKERVGILQSCVNSLEHRRDMLIQLSARQRANMYNNNYQ